MDVPDFPLTIKYAVPGIRLPQHGLRTGRHICPRQPTPPCKNTSPGTHAPGGRWETTHSYSDWKHSPAETFYRESLDEKLRAARNRYTVPGSPPCPRNSRNRYTVPGIPLFPEFPRTATGSAGDSNSASHMLALKSLPMITYYLYRSWKGHLRTLP